MNTTTTSPLAAMNMSKRVFALSLASISIGCGGYVTPDVADAWTASDGSPSLDQPLVTDSVVHMDEPPRRDDGERDSVLPSNDGGMLSQPSNCIRIESILIEFQAVPTVRLTGTFPGPFSDDGLHGTERVQNLCYVRDYRDLRLRNVGVMRLRSPRLDQQRPAAADLYYSIGQRDYPDQSPELFTVSTTGSGELGPFEIAARLLPTVTMLNVQSHLRDLPRTLATNTLFRWRVAALSGDVLFVLRGANFSLECRVPPQRGEFQFPAFVAQEIQNVTSLALYIGTSDERTVMVGETLVVLSTHNIAASNYYADP